jgi:hypothetical protein
VEVFLYNRQQYCPSSQRNKNCPGLLDNFIPIITSRGLNFGTVCKMVSSTYFIVASLWQLVLRSSSYNKHRKEQDFIAYMEELQSLLPAYLSDGSIATGMCKLALTHILWVHPQRRFSLEFVLHLFNLYAMFSSIFRLLHRSYNTFFHLLLEPGFVPIAVPRSIYVEVSSSCSFWIQGQVWTLK